VAERLAGPEEEVSSKELVITTKQYPYLKFANELYRPSDHRLSAKLVPIFADGGSVA
jgi:hypothetical protein